MAVAGFAAAFCGRFHLKKEHMQSASSTVSDDAILGILGDVAGLPGLKDHLDLDLFDEGLLDSLGLARLLVELSDKLGINLTPADVRREEWATPRLIVRAVRSFLPA